MNAAGPNRSSDLGQLAKAMQKRIDQGSLAAGSLFPSAGVDCHTCRLVENSNACIFINHSEGNLFGKCFERRPIDIPRDHDFLAAPETKRGLGMSSIDG